MGSDQTWALVDCGLCTEPIEKEEMSPYTKLGFKPLRKACFCALCALQRIMDKKPEFCGNPAPEKVEGQAVDEQVRKKEVA